VNCAANFLFGQGDDHPFDLPPVAKAQDVTLVPACFGARRGLEPGVVALGLEQQCGIGQRTAAIDEGRVHWSLIIQRTLLFGSQTRLTKR
jgi:hypothetical protein